MRLVLAGVGLVGTAVTAGVALEAGASPAASAALPYYLSLGDSYSIGYQPEIGGTAGFTGYIAAQLDMQAENFGCGGATTTSMLDSAGCGAPASQDAVPYANTQEQAALAFIAAHPGQVSLITMSIGGNDFDGCSTTSCVQAAMPTMEANIKTMVASLAAALSAASDTNARILGLSYPDVDLGLYVFPTNPPTTANVSVAQSSIVSFDDLINPTLSQAYLSVPVGSFVNVTSAPFGNATQGDDTPLSTTEQVPPYGTQRAAVGEICQLTYFCSLGNIHADTAGYTFIGELAVAKYESLMPPGTAVLSPSDGTTLSGSTFLDASASNAASVEFLLFGGAYGYSAPVVCTATPTLFGWLCAWNTTTVPNGSYVLVSEAFNSVGSTFGPGVRVTIENSPPTTAFLVPSDGATLSGSTYLDAAASNAASVEFLLFGGAYGYSAPVVCTATPTLYGWLCAWNTATVPHGSYVVVPEAFNSVGSTFGSGVGVTIES